MIIKLHNFPLFSRTKSHTKKSNGLIFSSRSSFWFALQQSELLLRRSVEVGITSKTVPLKHLVPGKESIKMLLHRRGWSLSSLESFGDLDDDELFFNDELCASDRIFSSFVPPPPQGGVESPLPMRRRLGVGDSVNAVSSPEIKALDLPLTPAFPRKQKRQQKKQHHRTKSVPLAKQRCMAAIPDPPPKSFVIHIDNEHSDAQMPSHGSLPPTPPVKAGKVHKKVLCNRSNLIHPNENDNDIKEKSNRRDKVQKTPSHRRLSVDSLPSPEELADDDLSKTYTGESLDLVSSHGRDMNNSLASFGDIKNKGGPKCRPKVPFRERSLNVTTAFR